MNDNSERKHGPSLSPLTYWVWRTVREHGPITSDALCKLLPEMPVARVRMRLYNLRDAGYLASAQTKAYNCSTFSITAKVPRDEHGLEALLQANPVFQGQQKERGRTPREVAEPIQPQPRLLPPPPQPMAPHNHWASCTGTLSQHPPVVGPGSLDARRLPSLAPGLSGRTHDNAARALGVVEAGARNG